MTIFLNLGSGRFISTSSHIYDSCYLPIFLFQDGSLTLKRMASLTDLAMFRSSLLTMLNLSVDMS